MTLGALFIGVAALIWELAAWYPGYKALQARPMDHAAALLPFLSYWAVGALAAMCVGGIVAMVTDFVIWGVGWLGDGALVWGVGGTRQTAPTSADIALTEGGLFIAALVLVAALVRRKKGAADSKGRGILSGVLMGTSAGIARVAAVPLASSANLAGVWITGLLS